MTIWHHPFDSPPAECSLPQWECLRAADSITERLHQISGGTTHLKLLSAAWGALYPEEATLLGNPAGKTWIREIFHMHQEEPWVWGRTATPEKTLQNTGLDGQTTQSIGNILFKDPHLKRTELALAQLPSDHPYCCAVPPPRNFDQPLWARRSVLWFHGHPLFVAEVFLPAFFMYGKN